MSANSLSPAQKYWLTATLVLPNRHFWDSLGERAPLQPGFGNSSASRTRQYSGSTSVLPPFFLRSTSVGFAEVEPRLYGGRTGGRTEIPQGAAGRDKGVGWAKGRNTILVWACPDRKMQPFCRLKHYTCRKNACSQRVAALSLKDQLKQIYEKEHSPGRTGRNSHCALAGANPSRTRSPGRA